MFHVLLSTFVAYLFSQNIIKHLRASPIPEFKPDLTWSAFLALYQRLIWI